MKAVVFESVGKIALKEVAEPRLQAKSDVVMRITTSGIGGTDLQILHGAIGDMVPGTILGHEGVGIVEQVASGVRNLRPGDRVVVTSSIACGYCSYCRAGYYSQCDNVNKDISNHGTAFFGGPRSSGSFNGLQAERARIPFANINAIKIPKSIPDELAVLLSDVFPTGFFGAKLAQIRHGDIVAVLGCGSVGICAIGSAFYLGAGRVFAIDHIPERLERARALGAEVINFEEDDPVEVVMDLTGGIGADRVIDAVGIEAQRPHRGPSQPNIEDLERYDKECNEILSTSKISGKSGWRTPEAPMLALEWSIKILDKAGTLAIIGMYPDNARLFPIGVAVNKNITINMGMCNHHKYIPQLIDLLNENFFDVSQISTKVESLSAAIDAYRRFDWRLNGTLKMELRTE